MRAARGISQKDLAQRAGSDRSYISLIEKGQRSPSTGKLEAIAKVLRVPMHLLSLLASDPDDLVVDSATAAALSTQLLDLLIDSQEDAAGKEVST